jgi:signal peptidase II
VKLSTTNFRDITSLLLFFGTAAVALTADLVSKYAAFNHLSDGTIVRFIPGWLHFEYTVNYGAVFGIGQGQRPLFLIVSVLALGFLTWLFAASGKQRGYQFILGMLLAGVIGNLYDRFVYGHVRDMLHALPGWYWPDWLARSFPGVEMLQQPVFPYIFNIADVMLVCGVTLMLIHGFFFAPSDKPPVDKATPQHTPETPPA